jgi:cation diffusion facilitator family transporter
MRGVFLHVLADTMGSVAAIASSFLESRLHWHWADPLCSLLVAACILAVALPLLRDSSTLLMLRLPEELRGSGLRRCLAAVRALPHVREVTHCRVWSHTRSRALGTVCVRADAGASERLITARVSSTMRSFGVHATAVEVQLEDADAPEARQDESSLEDVLSQLHLPRR